MLNVFDESGKIGYSGKIEKYLSIKMFPDEKLAYICFHCSQTIDSKSD